MKFGLFHTVQWLEGSDPARSYEEAIREITHADDLGFHSVFLTEHHFSRHGIVSDSLAVLSHLAALTRRIRLGTAVTVLPFHNPVRAAETAATVDLLSHGRLDFGTGRGYQWQEFNGFGVPIDERAARFEEAMELIIRSWTASGPFEFESSFWRYGTVDPQPKPVQRPHPPVFVATDNEEGFRRCARAGYGVMLRQGTSLEVLAAQVAEYRRILDEEGMAFDPTKLVAARGLHVAETDDAAWDKAGSHYVDFVTLARQTAAPPGAKLPSNPFTTETVAETVVFGSPDSCVRQIETLRAMGLEYLLFFSRFGRLAHERILRSLELFASEVAPRLGPHLAGSIATVESRAALTGPS